MNLGDKTNIISIIVILICVVLGIIIYSYTGNILVAIIIIPPVIHWMLKNRDE